MDHHNISETVAKAERIGHQVYSTPTADIPKMSTAGSPIKQIGYTDGNSHGNLNTTFAQLNIHTLRHLFPDGYDVTCRTSGSGRRCKTPTLRQLWMEMNTSERVIVHIVQSGTQYLVPAKLLCERSAWFSAELEDHEFLDKIMFTMARAAVFESVLEFMCTGILRLPSQENELDVAVEMCMLACKLKMEDLEWCAVGSVQEYLTTHKDGCLSLRTIEHVLQNTECTSHLRECVADHVAGCLSNGRISAESAAGFIVTAPDFAVKVMMSMQGLVMELTNVLFDADVSNIQRARNRVMYGGSREREARVHQDPYAGGYVFGLPGYMNSDTETDEDNEDDEMGYDGDEEDGETQ